MSRVRKTFIACALLALTVTAATSAAPASHRGGTLKLLAKAAGGTLDPQVNYTLEYWQLYQATYDGLLGFKKAGGNGAFDVVPDLAESLPKPGNGGRYDFRSVGWYSLRRPARKVNRRCCCPAMAMVATRMSPPCGGPA